MLQIRDSYFILQGMAWFLLVSAVLALCLIAGCKKEYVVGSEALVHPAIPPRVIETFPPRDGVGPFLRGDGMPYFGGGITFRFNKIMERRSVLRALRLSQSDSICYLDSLAFVVKGGDKYQINIRRRDDDAEYYHLWKVGQKYEVMIDTSAVDVNGNHLPSQEHLRFIPEPVLRIVDTNVALTGEVVGIAFNSRLDSSILKGVAVVPVPDSFKVSFNPSRLTVALYRYHHDTRYEVRIDRRSTDSYGNSLPVDVVIPFVSDPFEVIDIVDVLNDSLNPHPRFVFSSDLDTSTIRQAVTITPTVDFRIVKSAQAFSIRPACMFWPAGCEIVITIGRSLTSALGDSLREPYEYRFTTRELVVKGTTPADGAVDLLPRCTITMDFSLPVDESGIRAGLSIEPLFDFSMTISGSRVMLSPSVDQVLLGMTYTITLTTATRAKCGGTMQEPYAFSFTIHSLAAQ